MLLNMLTQLYKPCAYDASYDLNPHQNLLVMLEWMKRIGVAGAGLVQQSVDSKQLLLLVGALCSDAVRGIDQAPAQQQLLAVIYNTISLAGDKNCRLLGPAQLCVRPMFCMSV